MMGERDAAWARPAQLAMLGDLAGKAVLDLDGTPESQRAAPGSFDLATSWLALHRAPDPVSVLRRAHRALRPGGRLIALIPHPCTAMPFHQVQRDAGGRMQWLGVDRYFDGNPLEVWFAWIRDAGFEVTDLREPVPTEDAVRARPELEEARRVPYFLMFELSRTT